MIKIIDDNSRISDYLFLKNLDVDEKSLKSIYRIISGDPLRKDFENNKIREVANWYLTNENSMDAIPLAATFYFVFNTIKPFEKDNMRMAQIFMNVILLKHGFPPLDISLDNRLIYLSKNKKNREENIKFIEDLINKEINGKKFDKKISELLIRCTIEI